MDNITESNVEMPAYDLTPATTRHPTDEPSPAEYLEVAKRAVHVGRTALGRLESFFAKEVAIESEKPSIGESPALTAQEISVGRLLALGCSFEEIATDLVLSRHTIKFHAMNIYAKLNVSSIVGLIHLFQTPVDHPKFVKLASKTPGLNDLTIREEEILNLASTGLTTPDIAAQLYLGPQTVKFHLTNVYKKLGVSGRAEAAVVLKISVMNQNAKKLSEAAKLLEKANAELNGLNLGT